MTHVMATRGRAEREHPPGVGDRPADTHRRNGLDAADVEASRWTGQGRIGVSPASLLRHAPGPHERAAGNSSSATGPSAVPGTVQTDTEGPTAPRRALLPGLVLAGVAVLGGACAGDDTVAEAPSDVVVELVAFKPDTLTVEPGAVVTWTQRDAGAHTVTSGTVEQGAGLSQARPDGRFDSGPVERGGTFRFTFTQPGTYEYFCSLHPATMRGEVVVR